MDLEHTVGLRPDGFVWLPDRRAAAAQHLKLLPGRIYIHPSGYKRVEEHSLALPRQPL